MGSSGLEREAPQSMIEENHNSRYMDGETLPMISLILKHALRGRDRLGTGSGKRQAVNVGPGMRDVCAVDWGLKLELPRRGLCLCCACIPYEHCPSLLNTKYTAADVHVSTTEVPDISVSKATLST